MAVETVFEFCNQLCQESTPEGEVDLVKLASDKGFSFSETDLTSALSQMDETADEELKQDMLAGVAGGRDSGQYYLRRMGDGAVAIRSTDPSTLTARVNVFDPRRGYLRSS